jgi:hypothetical protein
MLDVHAPHDTMEGFKDFFLHLITITVGLLIALSLEGCVEWHHHRTLVREADAGLHAEIEQNVKVEVSVRQQIKDEEKQLDQDLAVLAVLRAHPDAKHQKMGFTFRLAGFDEVSWKTAQTTGAFAYMPYTDARTYSDIYAAQDELYTVQQQVVADVMRAAALVVAQPEGIKPSPAQIDELTDHIGMVQMRLILLESMVDVLDATYQKYRSNHP